jgi:putative ABC transport system permease protein
MTPGASDMTSIASDFASDIFYGLRQVRANLSLALLCVAVLAIGVGTTTAVFAVLYGALLKPLPYRDATRIVFVHNEFPASQLAETDNAAPDYADLSTHHELFSETAAYYFNDLTMTRVSGSGYAEHVDAVNTTASFFPLLGIRPEIGRAILPKDDRYGAPGVTVLSDVFWRSRFAADPKAIGRTVLLDGHSYQIVGVMPSAFNFPYPATQMWVPLALPPKDYTTNRGGKFLRVLARLAPAVSIERANSMLASVGHQLANRYPGDYPEKEGWHFSIRTMLAERTASVRKWLLLAFGAVVCVLLIACANVSGLVLVRSGARTREWAVRSALGASRGRLARQILTETGLLALSGCAAGIGVAAALVRLINLYGPIHGTRMEAWALAFVLGLCVLSTLTAGLLPAMLSSRQTVDQSLRTGCGRTTTGQSRWRGALVAGQIAVALALLFTATALSRSFVTLLEVSPGFSPERVWTGCVQLPVRLGYTNPAIGSFFETLVKRVAALPGVESASAGTALPFSSSETTLEVYFPGRPQPSVQPAARANLVLPGYFETLKIPLLEGRTLTPQDDGRSPFNPIVVVNESFARTYFPGQDPIGKLVANNCCHDQADTIVGVVGNVSTHDLGAPPGPAIYWPELQLTNSAMFLVVREAGKTDLTSAVRDILHRQDPSVALFDVETMPARIADSLKLRRFVAWLLNSFAAIGAMLAALGLYGTLAYLVHARRREMAIRMALGAMPHDVARLVARHSLSLLLAGLLPGAILCVVATQAMRTFLFGVAPLDFISLVCIAAGLLAIAGIASWLPVAQAARLDPLSMLRDE